MESTSSNRWNSSIATGLLAPLLACLCACAGRAPKAQHGVVVVAFEGLRQDRWKDPLVAHASMPNLLRLAKEGSELAGVRAPSSWAPSSFASLLTGTGPWNHGLMQFQNTLAAEHVTVAESASSMGWHTALFSSDTRLSAARGLTQGFQVTEVVDPGLDAAGRLAQATHKLLEQAAHDGRSFLIVVVLADPLPPWPMPQAFEERPRAGSGLSGGESLEYLAGMGKSMTTQERQGLLALHDSGAKRADRALGSVLDSLKGLGLEHKTLVVATSLCGTFLGEDDFVGEGGSLAEAGIHVPFIARGPFVAPAREIQASRSLVSLAPSVLEFMGAATPQQVFDAPSFLLELRGVEAQDNQSVFGEMAFEPSIPSLHQRAVHERAVIAGGFKLIEPTGPGSVRLFDLVDDPAQSKDLAGSKPKIVERLGREFAGRRLQPRHAKL